MKPTQPYGRMIAVGLIAAGLLLTLGLVQAAGGLSRQPGEVEPALNVSKQSPPSARRVIPTLQLVAQARSGSQPSAPCAAGELCAPHAGRALAPTGQDFLIAQGTTDLLRPMVAAGGMVVWYSQGADGMDVFGLRIGQGGSVGDKPMLIAGGAGDQTIPAIAVNKAGGYLVVWQQRQGNGGDLYARYLASDGRPQGDPFAIVTAEGDQLRPSIAYVPASDTFLVAWQDARAGGPPDVYARLVPSGSGSTPGTEFVVSDVLGNHLIPTAACETGKPVCLVVWQDDRNVMAQGTDVYGRLVDVARNAVMGEEIAVAVEPEYQFSPEVAFNPVSAEYMVVWNDNISARRVSRTGQPLGDQISISRESPFQYKPAVAVGTDGSYLIVWEDLRDVTNGATKIYGQWLSPSGALAGPNFALSTDPRNQYSPSLTFSARAGGGAFLAAWEDARGGSGHLAVYGQWILSAAGGQ